MKNQTDVKITYKDTGHFGQPILTVSAKDVVIEYDVWKYEDKQYYYFHMFWYTNRPLKYNDLCVFCDDIISLSIKQFEYNPLTVV